MIRRATWLAAGAVLGVLGYRRLDRVTRSVASQAGVQAARRLAGGWPGRGAGSAAFVREVRAGMTEYLDEHQVSPGRPNKNRQDQRSANTLVDQRAAGRLAIPGRALRPGQLRPDSDDTKDGR